MNKRSIAFQLGIYVLTTVIVVISLIVFLNYEYSRKIIMEKIEDSAIHHSGLIINQISRNVVTNQEVTRNVADQVLYYNAHGDLELFLKQVVRSNLIVKALHIKLFYGKDTLAFSAFRDKKGEINGIKKYELCPLGKHPELEAQIENGKEGIWSNPFYCSRDSSMLMISYFLPVKNSDNGIVGVLSSDIGLDFINDAISRIEIENQGVAFIISEEGKYLTHPQKDWVMKRNIFDASEKIFDGSFEKYRKQLEEGDSGSGFVYPHIPGYGKSWFYFAPIPYTNWQVIILIPAKALFKDLNVIFRDNIVVSVAGIILILLIIILIFNKMLSPLAQVVKSIQRFSFGERGRRGRKNEIELLHESLKELQIQYGTYIKEQDQIRKDKRKYEKDLKSAKAIQRTIIPHDYDALKGRTEIELNAVLQPAESIGGDLYDYFFIDSSHVLFTIGDVSGKGIPAALFMAVAHTMIKSKATVLSAVHIVDVVNKALSKENSNQHFLTLFLGILDVETGILDYCNAAHNYPFLIRKNKEIIQLEQTHGLPIGVYSNKTYKSNSIVLSKEDMLVLYTDGVTDCRNEAGEFFGMARLTELVQTLSNSSPDMLVPQLMQDLMSFKGKAKQADDISLMAVKFNGKYE